MSLLSYGARAPAWDESQERGALVLSSTREVARLFVVALGTGRPTEIAFGVSHVVLPIVPTVVAAASRVDPQLLKAAGSMGAGRAATIGSFVLPAIVPELITALRVGENLSLIGAVSGQVLVSVDGVGVLITRLMGTLQAAKLDAVVLAVCTAAIVVNVGLRAIECRLGHWRLEGRSGAEEIVADTTEVL